MNKLLNTILALVLAASIGIAGFLGYRFYDENKPVKAENFVGKNVNAVYEFCGTLSHKYSCNITYEESETFNQGIVIFQSVNEGENIPEVFNIKVSSGIKQKIEPMVVSSTTTLADVELWANKYGLTNINTINEASETIAKGIVIRVELAENEFEETVVTVIISSGSNSTEEEVVDGIEVKYGTYIGKSEDEFKKIAKELKLSPNHKTEQDAYSNDIEKGKIVWHGSGIYEENETFNYGLSKGKDPGSITVKFGEYVGKTEDEFKKIGTDLGLKPTHKESKDDYSDTVAKGKIVWHGSGEYVKDEVFNYGLSLGPAGDKILVESGKYVGKTEDEFKKIGTDLGLKPTHNTKRDDYSDTIAKGSIVWHGSGSYVKDEVFNYGLSLGKAPKVTVSSYAGKSYEEFKAYVEGLGLATGTRTEKYSDSVAKGIIISNDTGEMSLGSKVNYTISLGKDTRVTVGSYAGKDESELTTFLSNNGLVGSKSTQYSDSVAEGKIISNTTGTFAAGETVNYVVSSGVQTFTLNALSDIRELTKATGDYDSCVSKLTTYLDNCGFTNYTITGDKSPDVGEGVLLSIKVDGSNHVSRASYGKNATIVCVVCTGYLEG